MSKVLIKNIQTLFQVGEDFPAYKKGIEMNNLPSINDAFLALEDGIIVAYGPMSDWGGITDWRELEVVDASGKFVFPAFCDSHTHPIFAASRENEFVDRIHGLSYQEIAENGGGILNSALKLQDANEDVLFNQAVNRVERMLQHGTAAIEMKSGYGLSFDAELKQLRVIKRLKQHFPTLTIKSTFLGAHAIPQLYKTNRKEYIDLIINEMIPVIAKEELADFIDVFCETNYFTVEEMTAILHAGKKYNLVPKVHVNQFTAIGGVEAAVEAGALSVDHLEVLTDLDVQALKKGSTMPVFLPGCSFFLGIPYGDAKKLISEDLPFALASDFNPGSTPCLNLGFIFTLACTQMKLTPEQALNALTINAAYAMGIQDTHGTISLGKKGAVVLTKEIPSLAYLPYAFAENHIERTFY